METEREFVPARADIAQLSELADLQKVSILSYNVLSQMGARRLLRHENGAVDETLLRITRRRELLLEYVASELLISDRSFAPADYGQYAGCLVRS